MDWLSSKVVTSIVVLVITGSFLGLFNMQADYYKELELRELADALTDLVTEVDTLTCQARVEVNWTSELESHGLPRYFHGEPYLIQFTSERPYILWNDVRVKGRFFTSSIGLLGSDDMPVQLLEIPSTTGFVIRSQNVWADWGLGQSITVEALE